MTDRDELFKEVVEALREVDHELRNYVGPDVGGFWERMAGECWLKITTALAKVDANSDEEQ